MSFTVKTDLLRSGHWLRPGGNFKKTSVTIHSTGNLTSTPEGERKWLDNVTNKRSASWHYVVGEGVVIQAIPDNETAWHCGNSTGNNHSIGIEIVESGNRAKVLMTAAEFTAELLKKYGWGIDKLKRHYDWTGKNCPRILIDKTYIKDNLNWQWFLKTVSAFLADRTEKIKVIVDGKEIEVERILQDGYNFVKLRDIADICGFDISYNGNIPVLTKKG